MIVDTIIFDPNGCYTHPHIAEVEGLLGGIGRLVFPDGTVQFAENESFPEIVYSPRLTEDELELFCKNNIYHYEKYFNEHFDAIDLGDDLPPIDRFWGDGLNGASSNEQR